MEMSKYVESKFRRCVCVCHMNNTPAYVVVKCAEIAELLGYRAIYSRRAIRAVFNLRALLLVAMGDNTMPGTNECL